MSWNVSYLALDEAGQSAMDDESGQYHGNGGGVGNLGSSFDIIELTKMTDDLLELDNVFDGGGKKLQKDVDSSFEIISASDVSCDPGRGGKMDTGIVGHLCDDNGAGGCSAYGYQSSTSFLPHEIKNDDIT